MAHVVTSPLRSAMNSIRLTGHLPIVFPHTIIYPLPRFLKLLISKPSFLCRPICSCALHSQAPLPSQGDLLILKQDERFSWATGMTQLPNSSTIAAIVTSLGGPPAAVGIVRLSGSESVDIARKVFRPIRKSSKHNNVDKGDTNLWKPTSHVVEYGVVLDVFDNIVDEVFSIVVLQGKIMVECQASSIKWTPRFGVGV